MIRKCFVCFGLVFFLGASFVFAQDEDLQSTVDYKVNKMKTTLDLTEAQAGQIKPIIKDYLVKRQAVLQEAESQGIMDHFSLKESIKALKEIEYQGLSKILSEDQLKKWINKENLMATLNPDSMESAEDDGPSLTASGASFKF